MVVSSLRRLLPFAAALCLALSATAAPEPAFIASLAPATASALGLDRLTAAERDALDALVARDVASARQGGVTAFRGTFSGRRAPAERMQAGLAKLSADELARLDEHVAAALAQRPLLVARPPRPADTEGIDVSAALKPELHGRVTLGYGWGSGGSYRFGSVETTYYDPASRVTLGVGLAAVSGRGACFRY